MTIQKLGRTTLFVLEELDAEIQREANALTSELLPRLLRKLLQPNREGLTTCERHSRFLVPYVTAQILLTRAKRQYHNDDWMGAAAAVATTAWKLANARTATDGRHPVDTAYATVEATTEARFHSALSRRDEIRKQYRSTPCTCWVRKR